MEIFLAGLSPNGFDNATTPKMIPFKSFLLFSKCPNYFLKFEKIIKPGKYRIRVYFSNLESVIDPDIEALDYYKIEMWLDNNTERKVLKQYYPLGT